MLRCPRCLDDHEDDALLCGSCGVPLREVDAAGALVGPALGEPGTFDARLGTFHPAVAERITRLLDDRAIGHRITPRDDGTEVRIDPGWRDDLRSELTLSWDAVLADLDPVVAREVRGQGGRAPGWYDAPQGGYVDRAGRLVVSAVEDDEDEARIVGPALVATGAILGVIGWYVLGSGGILTAGIALVVLGLLLPR